MNEPELSNGLPAQQYDRSDEESLRMQRGQVGGFADYLNTGQIRMIEETCSRKLRPEAKKLLASTGALTGQSASYTPLRNCWSGALRPLYADR